VTVPHSPLSGFLSGVTVLDLSQYIPGPMAALFLSDMGADVLKIEPPGGDEMQRLGPRDTNGRPVFYQALNAGKRVIRLDLKDAGGRDKLLDLARTADVLIEGFRPDVMARLGIGWAVLTEINPRLIMCSISGYGATSTQRGAAGHDANYLAQLGVMHRNGDAMPTFYDPPLADIGGTFFAAMTILGALNGRARTGKGCRIDLALADAIMPMQLMQIAEFGANGTVPARRSTYLNGGAAFYQVYATADGGHVVLGAVEPKFWCAFCDAAGRPDLIGRQNEPIPQHALTADVANIFAGLTREQAVARFGPADCCVSVVSDLGEALNSSHVASRELVRVSPDGQLQALYPAWIDGHSPQSRPSLAGAATGLPSNRTSPEILERNSDVAGGK
jgi:crotonobetainyl-CoA:carnitine CoA-transferase CaiB-like acyl-CoA transferase